MLTKINNVHHGEILLEEFLKPLNISQNKIAKEFSAPPEFLLNLQNMYDMEEINREGNAIYCKIRSYDNAIISHN